MNKDISTFRRVFTRCLAVGVLLCVYCISIVGASAILLTASSTTADARGAAVVAEVLAVAEVVVFAEVDFVAVASVVAVFAAEGEASAGAGT